VEADVLAGPLLAARAQQAGVVYSLAYGDQPALIAEMVDWARTCGLEVVCAGKGTKYLPEYHSSTPDTVWDYYGLSAERARLAAMNPQMFNSFLDGTKSAIEMAAVANACSLNTPDDGLLFPAIGTHELPERLKPAGDGGLLATKGTVEVISSLHRDGSDVVNDLRWGVYCVFEAGSAYVERCFADYGLVTDSSGQFSAMYKPFHLIGLELGISVASAAIRHEPTGVAQGWHGDVVAVAKKDLSAGKVLDGEGGFCVWGKLFPAQKSRALKGLPIGLAHHVKMKRDVKQDTTLTWEDVEMDDGALEVVFRREMEAAFSKPHK
jgi:predicted homoserine dehydrogenase-like protein